VNSNKHLARRRFGMEIISSNPIDPTKVYELIRKDTAGSVVFHFAVVRESTENKRTKSIEFHPNGNLEQELRMISQEIHKRWEIEDALIIRRLGRLNIGDIISLVAVSSSHREEAFNACSYGVDRLKKMATLIKKETMV
jgi:molybdopterin synthase catalytic subunit